MPFSVCFFLGYQILSPIKKRAFTGGFHLFRMTTWSEQNPPKMPTATGPAYTLREHFMRNAADPAEALPGRGGCNLPRAPQKIRVSSPALLRETNG